MARFIYHADANEGWVELQADDGEELTPEQALAWGAIEIKADLDLIAKQMDDLISACQR